MDLGISGRKAIVCASSRGLGRACAMALAENGVEVVVNGRDEKVLAATAEAIADATGARVTAVAADVSTVAGQDALMAACPDPDILVNNNGGPPLKDFRTLERDAILDGVVQLLHIARLGGVAGGESVEPGVAGAVGGHKVVGHPGARAPRLEDPKTATRWKGAQSARKASGSTLNVHGPAPGAIGLGGGAGLRWAA